MNGLTNVKEFVDLVDSNNATPGEVVFQRLLEVWLCFS